jgi:hypothetical protein
MEDSDSNGMIMSCLDPKKLKTQFDDDGIQMILDDSVTLCGNIPRFNEFYIRSLKDALEKFTSKVGYEQFMKYVQERVVKCIMHARCSYVGYITRKERR